MGIWLKATVVALFTCVTAAAPAHAESPEERLVSMNAYIERGMQALDVDWASDPAQQAARIGAADEVSKNVKRALTPELQASAFYPPFAKNLARLDEGVANARIANNGTFARKQAIEALGRRDVGTTKATLDGLSVVLKRLQGLASVQKAASWLTSEKKSLDKNLEQLEQSLAAEKKALLSAELAAAAELKARQQAELKAKAEATIAARERAAADAKLRAQAEAELRRAEKEEEQRRAAAVKAEAKAQADAEAKAKADERARVQAAAREKVEAEARARAEEKERQRAAREADRAAAAAARAAEVEAAAEARRAADADRRRIEEAKAKEPPLTKALRSARERRDEIATALRVKPGVVSPKLFASAADAVKAVKMLDVERAALEDTALQLLVLRSAARGPAKAAPLSAKSTRQLAATVPTTTIDLAEGWCYGWVSSTDGYFKVQIEATTPVSTFSQSTSTSSQLAGLCTARAGRATLRVTRDDPQATLTIYGWPVELTPSGLLLHARLERFDSCNEAETAEAWRTPIPGALLFVDDSAASRTALVPPGPVLVLDPGVGQPALATIVGVDGTERQVLRSLLVDRVIAGPPPVVPATQCPAAGPRVQIAADVHECRKASDAAAVPLVRALGDRLGGTTDDARRLVAERELRALDDETARRRANDCRPVEVSPTLAWRRRLNDALVTVPPRVGDRARLLVLETTELP